VALAASILKLWLADILEHGPRGFAALFSGPYGLFYLWTALSFAIGAWFAFLLLRRRLDRRALWRVLLVTLVHAFGALRFYDWGLMLLSVLPLFAIAPRLLLSAERD
ncbi:MAG TPA: hypothetical protein VF267_01020, partial [Gammaproteobacteria bacterium]